MNPETNPIPEGGGVLQADGRIRPFTPGERRQQARWRAAEAAAKAWWETICPPPFQDVPRIPGHKTLHEWLMKFPPEHPDRRRFETVLRQTAALTAELSARYWAGGKHGRKRLEVVLRAIRQREMDAVENGGSR